MLERLTTHVLFAYFLQEGLSKIRVLASDFSGKAKNPSRDTYQQFLLGDLGSWTNCTLGTG